MRHDPARIDAILTARDRAVTSARDANDRVRDRAAKHGEVAREISRLQVECDRAGMPSTREAFAAQIAALEPEAARLQRDLEAARRDQDAASEAFQVAARLAENVTAHCRTHNIPLPGEGLSRGGLSVHRQPAFVPVEGPHA